MFFSFLKSFSRKWSTVGEGDIKRLCDRQGFTLIEVIVVVSILAIIAAIAIPEVSSWAARYRLRAAARDVYSALVKTRSEAVKRHENVALSFGQVIDGTAQAYVMYVDNGASPGQFDAGEEIILQLASWPESISLDTSQGGGDGLSFVANAAGFPTVVYRSNALLDGPVGGTVFLINTKNDTRQVVVSPTGAVRIE